MKKKILSAFVAIAMVFLCGCTAFSNDIKMGTAAIGGIYHEFGNAFSKIASGNDITIETKNTTGSAANVRLLSQDYIDIAIAQADIIDEAYSGEGIFAEKGKYNGYKAVASLYTEACHIVVRADSDIKSVDDLQNKKVSVGEDESGTEENANQILSIYGITSKMIEKVNLNYTDSATQLKDGKIDAFFCTTGTNATVIEELSKQCKIRLIQLEEKQLKKLQSTYKYYTEYDIPANTYEGVKESTKTIGVKSVLIAKSDMDTDKVKEITKMLFDNKESLQLTVSAPLELDEKEAVKGISIPFHSGAAEYYKTKNIDVETE